jgi:prepilin-type N-terminal cleavage/methylation domain-containing protein
MLPGNASRSLLRDLAHKVQNAKPVSKRRLSAKPRGFTLTELMIAMAIMAILSALAVYSVRKYVLVSKTAEPIEIINSIRAAEEAYKDETFTYLSATPDLVTLHPAIPAGVPDSKKRSWLTGVPANDTPWQQLGVNVSAPVAFGYACIGRAANQAMPALGITGSLNWPATPTTAYYVVKAVGDRDEDGVRAILLGSSFTDEIYSEKDDE